MDKSSGLDFINQMFPVEASLSCVESFMQKICDEIRRVDATILAVVSQQGNSGTRAKENLNDAICAAEELSHKIQEIKSKAEQTEAMVQDICSDIKKLDFAKKNITTAVTALSRLTMLVSAVQQLQVMTSKRQYKEAATQLEAINELCNHFKAYMDLPKIMELREKLKNIKQILKFHVFSDFSSLGTGTETEELFLLKKLSDSCLVVDALEPSVREELINNFCSRELTSYEQIYVGAELKTLDEIELIYNQLSCLIRKNQGKWTIFPASWHVPYRLCIQLSRKTRVQVESILVNLKEKSDVEKLLLELKRTLEFERELEMKFGGGGSIGDDIIGGGGNNSQKFNFRGMISSCFEPHLTIYIEKEEMELMQLLEKVVQEETWDIEEELGCHSENSVYLMLLDAHDMKMILLKVPSLARQPEASALLVKTATASYVKLVNHQMKRAEAVLKVIASPIVTVIDTYRALFPEETPMEFQRILVLKGLTKAEQQSILDDFNNHSSRITQLSVAAKTPEAHALPLALTNVAPAVRFKANSEEVLTRAASAATTSFMKLYALTGAAKDRPFRKLFNP
ncbi:Membrane trafficking VPS53 family protein [Arabidopsis thaliana]|uniref:Vacuolar protein sorting-associated protein 53 B n=1 Tax=Arabidopsis thaliana TaxID=3702 RepID=VP53B_ARATH|nr:Membrane trafficking VPS53 family protein [Arabidopsis thaliana]F4I7Y2.1 RecName: Full=Vacuolar protein sorting-associated protein 53 B [Arabidopsis thaliana]AEE32607.1 Membrane trafficking VPS53 family protein [Arabidopsis thaliana]|eukprot:NP_175510.2 Membrane trafficking VPS53 family protein [Arabidopsis thaliana]